MKRFLPALLVGLVSLLCASALVAGERGTFFFRGAIGGGGVEDIPLYMYTTTGSELYVKNSKGLNLAITAGYNFSPLLSAELQTGTLKAGINQEVSNGEGEFTATPLMLLLNYKLIQREWFDLYAAGGLSWFLSPELHREGLGVTDTVKYKNAVGPYLAVGFDIRFDPKWTMYFELGKPFVTYKYSSWTENGVSLTSPFSGWDNIDSAAIFYLGIGYNY